MEFEPNDALDGTPRITLRRKYRLHNFLLVQLTKNKFGNEKLSMNNKTLGEVNFR